MKRIRIRSLGLLAALAFIGNAYAADPGSIKIKILATSQALDGVPTTTTNITSTSTNLTSESKYTTANSMIDNGRLLQMLTNSFKTNFPSGSALKMEEGGDIVVVSGTTVLLDAVSVLSLVTTNDPIVSGSTFSKEKLAPGGPSGSSGLDLALTSAATLSYDDSALVTGDGTTTRFNITGVEDQHIKMSNTGTSEAFSVLIDFTGAGTGSISNSVSTNYVVLRATAVGALSAKGVAAP